MLALVVLFLVLLLALVSTRRLPRPARYAAVPALDDQRAALAIDFPIDAVYLWVDVRSPEWREAKDAANARNRPGRSAVEEATLRREAPLRYNDVGDTPDAELELSLQLLLRTCPWLRTVHIVTMRPQRPPCLQGPELSPLVASGRIRVVHHDEIWEDPDPLIGWKLSCI